MNVITHTFVGLKCLTETKIQILYDHVDHTRFHIVEMGCQMVQLLSTNIVGPTMCVNLTPAYVHAIRDRFSVRFGNRTGPHLYVVELFTPYWIDMLRVCFDLAKETWTLVQDNDNEIPFQKRGRSAEQPVHIKSGAFQKAIRYGTYHFWNRSVPVHNRHKNPAEPVG